MWHFRDQGTWASFQLWCKCQPLALGSERHGGPPRVHLGPLEEAAPI